MPTKAREQYAKDHAAQMADGRGGPSVNAKDIYAKTFGRGTVKTPVNPTKASVMAQKGKNQRNRGADTLTGGVSTGDVQVAPTGGVSPMAQDPGAVVGSPSTPGSADYNS